MAAIVWCHSKSLMQILMMPGSPGWCQILGSIWKFYGADLMGLLIAALCAPWSHQDDNESSQHFNSNSTCNSETAIPWSALPYASYSESVSPSERLLSRSTWKMLAFWCSSVWFLVACFGLPWNFLPDFVLGNISCFDLLVSVAGLFEGPLSSLTVSALCPYHRVHKVI